MTQAPFLNYILKDSMNTDNEFISMGNHSNESQTDEIKAAEKKLNRPKIPFLADTVLHNGPIMTRLFESLSHCSNASLTFLAAGSAYHDSNNSNNIPFTPIHEASTLAEAIFQILLLLNKIASQSILIIKPLYEFLNAGEFLLFC